MNDIIFTRRADANSMAGSLKKYLRKGESVQDILNDLQRERQGRPILSDQTIFLGLDNVFVL